MNPTFPPLRFRLGVGLFFAVLCLGTLVMDKISHYVEAASVPPAPVDEVVARVLAERAAEVLASDAPSFGDEETVNVLVLGIDSRKEGEEQHCDAIHLVSINVRHWTVHITSVPRGTYSYIPPGNYPANEYYLANACAYAGLEYGVAQIERVLGVKHDYLVTLGFSEAIGIFRVLDLPTTETLQWLRHRQSYAIGDPQRSQNQAVFITDMITRFTAQEHVLPVTLQYALYTFVETDMPYDIGRALYQGLVSSGISQRPEDITSTMKPFYATQNIHFDLENPAEQIAALLDRVRPYLSNSVLSNRSLAEVQEDLVAYLRAALQSDVEVTHVWDEQLWLQVEDEAAREELHYAFVERYTALLFVIDQATAVTLLTDYILEMQALGNSEYETKGKILLSTMVQ